MIEETYCSFEVAKLLKEKGFPMREHSMMYTNKNNVCLTESAMRQHLSREDYLHFGDFFIPTITCQMAMGWLREVHKIMITIIPQEIYVGFDRMCYAIYRITEDLYQPLCNGKVDSVDNSYEDAVEEALKYSLENLI